MKLIGKILVGFALIIVLILAGGALYIDIPVFDNVNEFDNYLASYSQVKYNVAEEFETLNAFNKDSLINKEVNKLKVNGEEVIVSYFRYKDPFTARSSINNYKEMNTGNFQVKTMEINIPFYGKYWIQTSQGITSISWTRKKRVILIRSNSRKIAKIVEADIKSYFK